MLLTLLFLVTPHDLRRTATTIKSEIGVSPFIKDRILNHRDPTVTGRYYDKYQYIEKRDALDAWGRCVDMIERYPDNSEPVPVKKEEFGVQIQ
jgi:hypothetical protein